MFAVASLRALAQIADDVRSLGAQTERSDLAERARTLADEIEAAVTRHAQIETPAGTALAYEVDGRGNYIFATMRICSACSPYL